MSRNNPEKKTIIIQNCLFKKIHQNSQKANSIFTNDVFSIIYSDVSLLHTLKV